MSPRLPRCCRRDSRWGPCVCGFFIILVAVIVVLGILAASIPSWRNWLSGDRGGGGGDDDDDNGGTPGVGPSFAFDPSLLFFYYPLQFNYTDVTGHTTSSLVRAGNACQPGFTTLNGLPTYNSTCQYAGSASGILVTGATITTTYTWSFYCKFGSSSSNLMMPVGNAQDGVNYYIQIDLNVNQLVVVHGPSTYVVATPFDSAHFSPGVQIHVVISYNDVSKISNLYINGQLYQTTNPVADSSSWSGSGNRASPLIGGFEAANYAFVGDLNHVRGFNIEVSAAQAAELYAIDTTT